jgi:hypothetical protein
MKINELDKNIGVTQQQLDSLENVLDRVFSSVGIDVEFTKHFIDRVNDERNIRPITIKELAMLFKKEFVKYGKPIAQLGPDAQAVMKDLETDINIPFVLNWNGEELELVAKTVMRKKDFKSSNKEFAVESDNQSGVYSDEKNNVEIHWKRIDHPSVAKDHLDIEAYQNGKRVDINNQQADHYRYLINQEMNETSTLGSKINFPGMSGTTVNTSTTTKTRVPTPKPARNRFDKIVNWSKSLFNSEEINEDIGSLPPLVDLIVLAVLAQTTVAGIKTMFKVAVKTGKGLNKLRKLTKQAGIALDAKLSESEMGEDFLAGKSEQEKKFWNAALEALHRLQESKESRQSIESYAFDIARSFNGMSSKELLALYKLKYGIDETLEEAKQSNPLVVLDKLADRSDNREFPVKFYDDTIIKVTPKKAKKFMDVYYKMADEQRDIIHKYIKTKKGFMQAINDFNIPM